METGHFLKMLNDTSLASLGFLMWKVVGCIICKNPLWVLSCKVGPTILVWLPDYKRANTRAQTQMQHRLLYKAAASLCLPVPPPFSTPPSDLNQKNLSTTFNSKNQFSSLNFSVFDLEASYFREKCIDEYATVSYFRNCQKIIVTK